MFSSFGFNKIFDFSFGSKNWSFSRPLLKSGSISRFSVADLKGFLSLQKAQNGHKTLYLNKRICNRLRLAIAWWCDFLHPQWRPTFCLSWDLLFPYNAKKLGRETMFLTVNSVVYRGLKNDFDACCCCLPGTFVKRFGKRFSRSLGKRFSKSLEIDISINWSWDSLEALNWICLNRLKTPKKAWKDLKTFQCSVISMK